RRLAHDAPPGLYEEPRPGRRVAGDGPERGDLGEIAREVSDDGGADEAAEQAGASAQQDVHDRARREAQAEAVGIHEATPGREENAGQAGDRAGDGEERELVEPRVVAEARHAGLVLANADGHASQPGPQEPAGREIHDDAHAEHEKVADRTITAELEP